MANVRTAVTGIDDIFKGLDALSTLREPVGRAMGVAMGVAVRDEAKERAPVLQPSNIGFDNQRENQLRDAIYLAFDGRRSILTSGHIVYGVSWNARKAPHGHLLEFGHWMPYEAHTSAKDGRWFTPIVKQGSKNGRKRGVGIPIGGNGFHVQAFPFLGPAFDAKLPRLNAIAMAAGQLAFGSWKP